MSSNDTKLAIQPREYQTTLVDAARERIRRGAKRILLQLPTGGGKTVVAALIIQGALAKGKRILFLAHRRELIEQPSRKLDELGVSHGIVMASHHRYRPMAAVQVASIQTLVNRELMFPPDLIFIDETHRATAKTYQSILERYPQACVIGLTATPVRSDGKGLGNLFQDMVCGPGVAELTRQGFLVPTRVYAPSKPELRDVNKLGGDYNQRQLGRVMDKASLTGDVVEHWQRLACDRLTIAFAVNVEHSQHLRDRFLEAGVAAEHLDGETQIDERVKILERVATGQTRVLCSVGVLTEGWDCPAVSCAILARPTMSEGLYLQMAGRILRPAAGKTDALVLDHAGCTWEHGFVDDPREWKLVPDIPVPRVRSRIDTSFKIKACPQCFYVWNPRIRQCTNTGPDGKACGYIFHVNDRTPETRAGTLTEVGAERAAQYRHASGSRKRELYLQWVKEGLLRNYSRHYAWKKYEAIFKESPKAEWMLEASLEHQAEEPGALRVAR